MSTVFALNDQRQGAALLAALGRRFATTSGERARLRRTAFDTFDWRLWRAGGELTGSRHGKEWTLHWRRSAAAPEISESSPRVPAFAWELPDRLRGELAGLLEMRRLLPLVDYELSRQEVRLLDRRKKTVARLRLESWRVRPAGGKRAERLPPLLLATPVRGFDRAFDRLLSFLESEGLERQAGPMLARAYEACGLVPGDYGTKIDVPLEPALPAHLAMRRIHLRLLETIRRNEDGLRRDLDSEFLHDFRVAVRRTRAALTQVKGVFASGPAAHFRSELSWLGGETGELRDLDVYLLKLDDYRALLPDDVAADLDPLEQLLARKQESAHRAVVRTLETPRYQRLLSEWALFLADEEAPDMPAEARRPIGEVAGERILAADAKVVRKGRKIGAGSPDEKLHRLRLDCKKLRYLLELFRGLYGPSASARPIKALKALQDNLGDFNDLSVQQQAMRGFAEELAEAGTPPAALMALGRLIAILARRQGEERRRFHDRFERFDRPAVRRRLGRLVEGGRP